MLALLALALPTAAAAHRHHLAVVPSRREMPSLRAEAPVAAGPTAVQLPAGCCRLLLAGAQRLAWREERPRLPPTGAERAGGAARRRVGEQNDWRRPRLARQEGEMARWRDGEMAQKARKAQKAPPSPPGSRTRDQPTRIWEANARDTTDVEIRSDGDSPPHMGWILFNCCCHRWRLCVE